MISDVPVGVLLSGGVDSTGILRYATDEADSPIHTFTVGFGGAEFADERPYARLAAKRFGTVHHETTMTAEDFRECLPKYVWHMEEPVFEPPAIALYHVARLARDTGVKVLLSGEGGDEAFGGYQNYRNLILFECLKSAFGPAKGMLRLGLQALGQAGWSRVRRYAFLVDPHLKEYYLSRTETPFTDFNRLKNSIYTKDFSEYLSCYSSNEPIQEYFEIIKDQPLLNQMLYVDTKTWLPDDLLIKADKMTMATSVELRVPLLDFKIMEFAASLPTKFKVRGWETKRILKSALEGFVPAEILKRKKTGFPVPYTKWLSKGEMSDFVSDVLMARNTAFTPCFRTEKIREMIDDNKKTGRYSKEIFCLLVLGLWNKAFDPLQSS
jgi:asparagine synthase (glutamine-hydrolysing)